MNCGLPYMGSKNRLAKEIVDFLPPGGTLVDLFAGGCAITHAAMLEGKWSNYIANDITDAPKLFNAAIRGDYANETRWISREDFARQKDTDAYVRTCWSFGNNQKNYLYAKEIEPWKKALHYARVLGDKSLLREMGINSDGSYQDVKTHYDEYKEKYIRWWLSKQEYSAEELAALIEKCKGEIKKSEEQLRNYLVDALKKSGLTAAEVGRRLGTNMERHYFGVSQWAFPTREYYAKMQQFMPLPQSYDEVVGLHQLWQSLESLQRLQSLQSLQSLQRLDSLDSLESLQSLERLERLQSLQRLQRLQSLQSLQSLEIYQGDYRDVPLPPDAIIYCDPPYINTSTYLNDFSHEDFYAWCCACPHPVIVSEYVMPTDRFVCVWQKTHTANLSATRPKSVIEGLFVPRTQLPLWRNLTGMLFLGDD